MVVQVREKLGGGNGEGSLFKYIIYMYVYIKYKLKSIVSKPELYTIKRQILNSYLRN